MSGSIAGGAAAESTSASSSAGVDDRVFRLLSGRLDLTAMAILRLLRDRSEADQVFVWRELADSLPPDSDQDERRAVAAEALRACVAETGLTSRRAYDDWLASKTRPHPYPASSQIRLWMGSWAEALIATELVPAAEVRARRMLSSGRAFTEKEMLDAVTLFAADHPADSVLLLGDYESWARREVAAARRRERLPLRGGCFARLGGWQGVLDRLGLSQRGSLAVRAKCPGPPELYGRDDLIATLRRAADDIGRYLTAPRYLAWRREQIEAARAAGRDVLLPHYTTHVRTFGTWREAMEAAGLPVCKPKRQGGPLKDLYTDEELEAVMVEVIKALGPAVRHNEFRHWRRVRLAQLAAAGKQSVQIPNPEPMRRLGDGSWERGRERVLARHPELRATEPQRACAA